MKFLILTVVLIGYASAASLSELSNDEWHAFKQEYGKIYENEIEEEFRRKIFLDNKRQIEKHNERFENGLVSFRMGANKFADLLYTEFVQMISGDSVIEEPNSDSELTYMGSSSDALPNEVDWRKKGAVTKVKDQGFCNSNYAFAAAGALEAQTFLKTGKLVELSAQNLVDCTEDYGNSGCDGGTLENAYQYIKDNGLETEHSYPYTAYINNCQFNASNVAATEKGYVNLPRRDENKLKEAVATIGPISVSFVAEYQFWLYSGGVFYGTDCSYSKQKHSALVVGYGTDNETGQDYWLVKNSWGTKWGEGGYIKMSRNRNNNCGIATMPSYPLV